MRLSTDAWLLALRLRDGARARALAEPRRISETMRGVESAMACGFILLLQCRSGSTGKASMRHPVELVLQVVARACWALESTTSRPKIITVRRSCVYSCCGLIEMDLFMEPPAQPCPGYSGGSCSVILASGHHGLAQSRRDLH